jgi:hypothetical protein
MVESTGLSLTYSNSSSGDSMIFDGTMTIFGYSSLIIFSIGSLTHKMMGV